MSDLAVETSGLRKVYRDAGRRLVALDALDLVVERGGVHGLLGPNGSGKTTTVRLLLGLAKPDAGTVTVLGHRYPGQVPAALARVGALLEQGHFSPGLSGSRNLTLLARAAGLPSSRVDEVLEQVDLRQQAKHRYADYPLGWRRKLGLAAALLKKPDLLVLDEPANGLDPAGIRDMRDTIPRLAASGVQVLLTSHIVAEVQEVCSAVSVLDEGRLVASGTVDELLGESTSRTRVGVAEPQRAAELLSAGGYQVVADGEHLVVEGHEHPEQITRLLADAGLYVHELHAIRPTLESYFLQLTGHLPPVPEDPAERAADQTAEHLRELEDGAPR